MSRPKAITDRRSEAEKRWDKRHRGKRRVPVLRAGESRCVRCGCTDSSACPAGCAWIVVDREIGLGLCSMCELNDREKKAAVLLWIRGGSDEQTQEQQLHEQLIKSANNNRRMYRILSTLQKEVGLAAIYTQDGAPYSAANALRRACLKAMLAAEKVKP